MQNNETENPGTDINLQLLISSMLGALMAAGFDANEIILILEDFVNKKQAFLQTAKLVSDIRKQDFAQLGSDFKETIINHVEKQNGPTPEEIRQQRLKEFEEREKQKQNS